MAKQEVTYKGSYVNLKWFTKQFLPMRGSAALS